MAHLTLREVLDMTPAQASALAAECGRQRARDMRDAFAVVSQAAAACVGGKDAAHGVERFLRELGKAAGEHTGGSVVEGLMSAAGATK